MSVLFSNTRTRLLYNEREIFIENFEFIVLTRVEVLKISSSLYSKQKSLTLLIFNLSSLLAIDYIGFLPEHCTVFMRYCNNVICHFDVAR